MLSSASWINAVEGFFSVITRRRIRRDVFTSVAALEEAIRAYSRDHNEAAKPFIWPNRPKPSSPKSTGSL
jgi:hypothetical protein